MDSLQRLKELEGLAAMFPPCPEHGVGCVNYARQWLIEAVRVMAHEEKMRAAVDSADPSTVTELLETQIRLLENENQKLKGAGAVLLIAMHNAIDGIHAVAAIETVYQQMGKEANIAVEQTREAVRAFGEALGVPLSPSEKTE